MVNACHTLSSVHSSGSCSQQMIAALGRLQAQTINSTLESIYVYDLIEQSILCASCSVASILGYTAEAIHAMGATGLANLIHPDDLNSVSEHYQRFTTLESGEVLAINYRMKRADGVWCWLRSQETPLVMAIGGFPLQILGIVSLMHQLGASGVISKGAEIQELRQALTVVEV